MGGVQFVTPYKPATKPIQLEHATVVIINPIYLLPGPNIDIVNGLKLEYD